MPTVHKRSIMWFWS